MLTDRTTWKYKKNILPYKERLAYLESKGTGKTSILTDFNPYQEYSTNNDITLSFKVLFANYTGSNYILGCPTNWFTVERGWNSVYPNIGSTTGVCDIKPSNYSIPIEINIKLTNGSCVITGDYSSSGVWGGNLPDGNLNIFGASLNDNNKEGTRYYYFKVYNGTALVYSYIPVLDEDNRPCMYDEVNNVFKYSAGTEDFNYGTL